MEGEGERVEIRRVRDRGGRACTCNLGTLVIDR